MVAASSIVDITWRNCWQNTDNAQVTTQYILLVLAVLTVSDNFLIITSSSRGLILEVQTASVNLHCLICDMHIFCMCSAENLTSYWVLHMTSDYSECQAFIFIKMISWSFSILLFWLLNAFWGLFSDHSDHSAALQLN